MHPLPRLLRRIPAPNWKIVGMGTGLLGHPVPALCTWVWMDGRVPSHVAQILRWWWFLGATGLLVVFGGMALAWRLLRLPGRRFVPLSIERQIGPAMPVAGAALVTVPVLLAVGNVRAAMCCQLLARAWNVLATALLKRDPWSGLSSALSVATIYAVVSGSAGAFIAVVLGDSFVRHGVALTRYARCLFGWSLKPWLRTKPSRSEYRARVLTDWPHAPAQPHFDNAGQQLRISHHWGDALTDMELADQSSETRSKLEHRCSVLQGLGRHEEVAELALAPGSEMEARAIGAVSLARMGRLGEAETTALRLVRHNSKGSERAMGIISEMKGYDAEALRWYERAAHRGPVNPDDWRDAARALMRLESYGEAAVAWRMSMWICPFVWPEDLEQLAECLDRTGRQRQADEARAAATQYHDRDE